MEEIKIDCATNVRIAIGWAPDMIGWAGAQPFPTLATPLAVMMLPDV